MGDPAVSLWGKGSNSYARQKLCRYILERDRYTCYWCGRLARTVDHVIARVDGGTDDPLNLVAACGPCNFARGAAHTNGRPQPSRRW